MLQISGYPRVLSRLTTRVDDLRLGFSPYTAFRQARTDTPMDWGKIQTAVVSDTFLVFAGAFSAAGANFSLAVFLDE